MTHRFRRISAFIVLVAIAGGSYVYKTQAAQPPDPVVNGIAASLSPAEVQTQIQTKPDSQLAGNTLEILPVKGRAPKTGYSRSQFGDGWAERTNATGSSCDMRNIILARDMTNVTYKSETDCAVLRGTLENDVYTGKTITFERGANSAVIQIDHVIALSNAWQTGAQQLTKDKRIELANDPLELLAVDGPANQQKSDGDAATWLPSNKDYRCRYIARQIAVKKKYELWVTSAERDAMRRILATCPEQQLPVVN